MVRSERQKQYGFTNLQN